MGPVSKSRIARFILLLATVVAPITAHADSMDAVLSFVEVVDEVTATTHVYRQARTLNLSVTDRSRVSDWNARRPGRPNERAQDLTGSVGVPIQIGRASLLWQLDGPDTLVRETRYPSFVETITITFHPGGCDATVTYRLKPGYAHFEIWNIATGVPMQISRIRAEGVRCKPAAAAIS